MHSGGRNKDCLWTIWGPNCKVCSLLNQHATFTNRSVFFFSSFISICAFSYAFALMHNFKRAHNMFVICKPKSGFISRINFLLIFDNFRSHYSNHLFNFIYIPFKGIFDAFHWFAASGGGVFLAAETQIPKKVSRDQYVWLITSAVKLRFQFLLNGCNLSIKSRKNDQTHVRSCMLNMCQEQSISVLLNLVQKSENERIRKKTKLLFWAKMTNNKEKKQK